MLLLIRAVGTNERKVWDELEFSDYKNKNLEKRGYTQLVTSRG